MSTPIPALNPEQIAQSLIDIADAAAVLLAGLADERLTDDEIAAALDRAIDTGPLDALDDGAIRFAVARLDDLTEALRRDPARMRARAAALDAKNPDRARRIRMRADKLETRRA